jgi:hypothetical protein
MRRQRNIRPFDAAPKGTIELLSRSLEPVSLLRSASPSQPTVQPIPASDGDRQQPRPTRPLAATPCIYDTARTGQTSSPSKSEFSEGACVEILPHRRLTRCRPTAPIFTSGQSVGWASRRIYHPAGNLIEYFTPFLLDLAASGLSKKTIQRHVDNLWLLGGEIIRDVNEDRSLRKVPAEKVVGNVIHTDGGPLIHNGWEDVQRSFDSTCRKFHRFLTQSQR